MYETATTDIYTYRHTLSRHDALPICWPGRRSSSASWAATGAGRADGSGAADMGSGWIVTVKRLGRAGRGCYKILYKLGKDGAGRTIDYPGKAAYEQDRFDC